MLGPDALGTGECARSVDEQLERWEKVKSSKVRRRRVVGDPNNIDRHPLWSLPSVKSHWLFGRFPKNRNAVRWFLLPGAVSKNEAMKVMRSQVKPMEAKMDEM